MKVAIVVPYFTPFVRGNEYGLAEGLSRLGVDVTILTSKGKAPREKMVIKNASVSQSQPFKVKYLPTLIDKGEIPITPTVFTEVLRGGYDALLLQEDYQPVCHIAYMASRVKRIPTIVSTERTYFPEGNKRKVLGLFDATFNKMVRKGSTAYTSHCSAARSFVEKELGVPPGRVKVVHVGIDTCLFKPTTGDSPLTEGKFKLLTVSRLHPYKGLEYLIRAMEIVKRSRKDIVLYIMGRGPSESDLKALISDLNLHDVVKFVEKPVPNYEMPKVYSSADLYLQPSIIEPYGIAVLEAAACGKPAICSKVGGMTDTVEDGITGHLVDPGSPKQLSEKILSMAADPEKTRAMGANARERAAGTFDWDVISRRYLSLIEEVARHA